MILGGRFTPAATGPGVNKIADFTELLPMPPIQRKDFEIQLAKTRQAFERLEANEIKVKTSATQILMAILHYAALQDNPAG